jgi:hypothetical protein
LAACFSAGVFAAASLLRAAFSAFLAAASLFLWCYFFCLASALFVNLGKSP